MRWFFNLFRQQKMAKYEEAIPGTDIDSVAAIEVQATINEINRLKKTDPSKARDQIAKLHQAYWNYKSTLQGAIRDQEENYHSFWRDSRFLYSSAIGLSSTLLAAAWASLSEGLKSTNGQCIENMMGKNTPALILLMTTIGFQAFFNLLYTDEASQLTDIRIKLKQNVDRYEAILIGVDERETLTKDPDIDAGVFNAR